MKSGTQIAYIPIHANGDINHEDVEFGFVVSEKNDVCFCRYWRKGQPGALRTVANSEATHISRLKQFDSVSQGMVDIILAGLKATQI